MVSNTRTAKVSSTSSIVIFSGRIRSRQSLNHWTAFYIWRSQGNKLPAGQVLSGYNVNPFNGCLAVPWSVPSPLHWWVYSVDTYNNIISAEKANGYDKFIFPAMRVFMSRRELGTMVGGVYSYCGGHKLETEQSNDFCGGQIWLQDTRGAFLRSIW